MEQFLEQFLENVPTVPVLSLKQKCSTLKHGTVFGTVFGNCSNCSGFKFKTKMPDLKTWNSFWRLACLVAVPLSCLCSRTARLFHLSPWVPLLYRERRHSEGQMEQTGSSPPWHCSQTYLSVRERPVCSTCPSECRSFIEKGDIQRDKWNRRAALHRGIAGRNCSKKNCSMF